MCEFDGLISIVIFLKDYLETKRSKAQSLETTFIHDFPDVFKLCLRYEWTLKMVTDIITPSSLKDNQNTDELEAENYWSSLPGITSDDRPVDKYAEIQTKWDTPVCKTIS